MVYWQHLEHRFYVFVTDRGSGNEKGISSDGKKSSDQGSKLDAGNVKTNNDGYFPTIICG